jgi:serine/threonine-protein kinase HipA
MAPRRPPLSVWLYGRRIAELVPRRVGDLRCRYTDEALDTWPGNLPLLSCSLPLGRKAVNADRYFRGMLPEGRHLLALATEARVATTDTYGLLARFGRDVAGAAVIAVDDPGARPGSALPYGTDELEAEVANLDDRPLAIYDDSELSIAGLQNKLLLTRTGVGWARPVGGRPSTHIS